VDAVCCTLTATLKIVSSATARDVSDLLATGWSIHSFKKIKGQELMDWLATSITLKEDFETLIYLKTEHRKLY
jgi:hypothetical protein